MFVSILASGQGIRDENIPLVYFGDELDFNQPGFHITSGLVVGLNNYNFVQREARPVVISGVQHLVISEEGIEGNFTNIPFENIQNVVDALGFVIKPYVLNIYNTALIEDFLFPEAILIDDFNFSRSLNLSLTTKSSFYFEETSAILYIPYVEPLNTLEIVGYFRNE